MTETLSKWLEENKMVVSESELDGSDIITIEEVGTFLYLQPFDGKIIDEDFAFILSDDEFDINIGVEVAKERALHKPAGELRSNNWTMLQDDQCEMLVKCEAEYIFNNIKKYINRK